MHIHLPTVLIKFLVFNVYALIDFLWQYATVLQSGTFEDARMPQNLEACDWLASALRSLDAPFLDANYVNMRAVSFSRKT